MFDFVSPEFLWGWCIVCWILGALIAALLAHILRADGEQPHVRSLVLGALAAPIVLPVLGVAWLIQIIASGAASLGRR